jgi:ferrochelatase
MMRETLEGLARTGSKKVLMAPVSFVSDHVETLFEIDIEHRQIAERAGIAEFRMAPGLNTDGAFIGALAGLVRRAASKRDSTEAECVRNDRQRA